MERDENSVRLGFDTCEDMMAKLEREGARLLASREADDVMNFCMTGHHLFQDWIPSVGTDAMRQRRSLISGEPMTIVQILYDVSNGSKHFLITRPHSKASRVLEKSYAKPINNWWRYFHAPLFNYETRDFQLKHEQFVSQILGYLSWVVRGPGDSIPQELLDQLQLLRKGAVPLHTPSADAPADGQ